jgi:hypothetical protein
LAFNVKRVGLVPKKRLPGQKARYPALKQRCNARDAFTPAQDAPKTGFSPSRRIAWSGDAIIFHCIHGGLAGNDCAYPLMTRGSSI